MAKTSGLASLSEGRSDLLKIDPRNLSVKANWNSRDMNDPSNIEHVDELAKSIAEIGVQVPLIAYWEDGKAYVSSGHCRLAATIRAIEVYKAEIKTVPVQIADRYANEADRIFGQIVHNQGKPFTPLEQAKVFKRLLDLGWQQNDIAKKAGMTASRVSQILDLLTLPEGVKVMVTAGKVSATLAVQTVNDQGGTAAEKALKEGLKVANKEGKSKVTASNLEGSTRINLKKLVRDALKQSDINDTAEIVLIRMSEEDFAAIIDAVDFNSGE